MNHPFRLNLSTHENRDDAIDRCKELILQVSGFVLGTQSFSDVSIVFTVEMSKVEIGAFFESIKSLGWVVTFDAEKAFAEKAESERVPGTIQLTFADATGDVRTIIPSVPG